MLRRPISAFVRLFARTISLVLCSKLFVFARSYFFRDKLKPFFARRWYVHSAGDYEWPVFVLPVATGLSANIEIFYFSIVDWFAPIEKSKCTSFFLSSVSFGALCRSETLIWTNTTSNEINRCVEWTEEKQWIVGESNWKIVMTVVNNNARCSVEWQIPIGRLVFITCSLKNPCPKNSFHGIRFVSTMKIE